MDYVVLKQTETPGLGAHIDHWFKHADKPSQNIIGRKAGALSVSKDGGEVDAITAATISSRAFLKAVNKAYAALAAEPVEAATGASQLQPQDTIEEVVQEVVEEIIITEEEKGKEAGHE